jgi:hypothetical protein
MKLFVTLSSNQLIDLDKDRAPFRPLPPILYHGTAIDFKSLDMGKSGMNDYGYLGRGMYFTSDPHHASAYARKSANRHSVNRRSGARVLEATWRRPARLYPFNREEYKILFEASRMKHSLASKIMSEFVTETLTSWDFDGGVYVLPDFDKTKEIVLYDLSVIDVK